MASIEGVEEVRSTGDGLGVHKKGKRRKAKSKAFLPPTCDEMIVLKETEMNYSSYLVREQLQSVIAGVKAGKELRSGINAFLKDIRDEIKMIEPQVLESANYPHIPFKNHPIACGFEQPLMNIVGGHAHAYTIVDERIRVEMTLEMQPQFVNSKDFLNWRVLDKMLLYLGVIGEKLSNTNKFSESVHWTLEDWVPEGFATVSVDRMVDGRLVQVILLPVIPEDRFPLKKLNAGRRNIRARKRFPAVHEDMEVEESPSSVYNSLLAYRILYKNHLMHIQAALKEVEALRDAILLLQVWFRQRRHLFRVNSHCIAMICSYLFHSGKITRFVNEFQIFKIAVELLATAPLNGKGLALSANQNPRGTDLAEPLENALVQFEAVVLDHTGYVNLVERMLAGEAEVMRMHAQNTLIRLSEGTWDCLEEVFYKEYPFAVSGDLLLKISVPEEPHHPTQTEISALCGVEWSQLLVKKSAEAIRHAFSYSMDVSGIIASERQEKMWRFGTTKGKASGEIISISIPLTTVPTGPIVEGPAANDEIAVREFKEFWGSLAEIRRFRDGRVIACALVNPISKAHFPERLVDATLTMHTPLGKGDFAFLSNHTSIANLVGESSTKSSLAHFRALSNLERVIRSLGEVLPLNVKSVFAVDPAFRYTDVDIPLQGTESRPLRISVELERSAAWTREPEVIARLKTGFLLAMSDHLREKFKIRSQMVSEQRLNVFYAKRTFQLLLIVDRDGTDEMNMSTYSTALHGFAGMHGSFGDSVRLFKRFLGSSFMEEFLNEFTIEALVAGAYLLKHHPPPHTALSGFVRTLFLIATHKWDSFPLIVDLAGSMEEEESREIFDNFRAITNRERPDMFVGTQLDATSSYSREHPTANELKVLSQRSRKCLALLEGQVAPSATYPRAEVDIRDIFNPVVSNSMDAIIVLKNEQFLGERFFLGATTFVATIKERFGRYVNVFWDSSVYSHRRRSVYLKWKPSAFIPGRFKAIDSAYQLPLTQSSRGNHGGGKLSTKLSHKDTTMIPNILSIAEDIRRVGDEFIEKFEFHAGII